MAASMSRKLASPLAALSTPGTTSPGSPSIATSTTFNASRRAMGATSRCPLDRPRSPLSVVGCTSRCYLRDAWLHAGERRDSSGRVRKPCCISGGLLQLRTINSTFCIGNGVCSSLGHSEIGSCMGVDAAPASATGLSTSLAIFCKRFECNPLPSRPAAALVTAIIAAATASAHLVAN